MEISTSEKIRFLANRENKNMGDIAAATGQTRQNFSNKLKRGDFKESELSAIAGALGYTLDIKFVKKETGEEF